MQVAVLLLIAGTILGALWADVVWGRFWSWDRKEVWSLVSIMVYMVILHGRSARWFGNFGLAVGSVVGFTAIVMTWYGLNYVLPGGLHTYGRGEGGILYVGAAVLCNWLLAAAAVVRYNVQARRARKGTEA
jgi:ABC-type transport system involved in cytochrome c biogenesis permease subunit